jgi:hypothetical protein
MPEFAGMTKAVIRRPEKQRKKKKKAVRGAPYSSRAGAKPLGQKDRIVRDSTPWSTTNLYTLPLTKAVKSIEIETRTEAEA